MRRKYLKFLEIVNGKQSERIKRKQQEPISATLQSLQIVKTWSESCERRWPSRCCAWVGRKLDGTKFVLIFYLSFTLLFLLLNPWCCCCCCCWGRRIVAKLLLLISGTSCWLVPALAWAWCWWWCLHLAMMFAPGADDDVCTWRCGINSSSYSRRSELTSSYS